MQAPATVPAKKGLSFFTKFIWFLTLVITGIVCFTSGYGVNQIYQSYLAGVATVTPTPTATTTETATTTPPVSSGAISSTPSASAAQTPVATYDVTQTWRRYTDDVLNVSFRIPNAWKVERIQNGICMKGTTFKGPEDIVTCTVLLVKSPKNNILRITFENYWLQNYENVKKGPHQMEIIAFGKKYTENLLMQCSGNSGELKEPCLDAYAIYNVQYNDKKYTFNLNNFDTSLREADIPGFEMMKEIIKTFNLI